MKFSDIGAQVMVHAAIIAVQVGQPRQGTHNIVIVAVTQIKQTLGSIASITHRHTLQQVLDSRINVTLTAVNISTVDIHLGLDAEELDGLGSLLNRALDIAGLQEVNWLIVGIVTAAAAVVAAVLFGIGKSRKTKA